jgi:hypothetical protein
VQAEWLDISGRVLAAKVFDEVAQGVQLTLPIPDHAGIKLLRITTPESQRVFKVY